MSENPPATPAVAPQGQAPAVLTLLSTPRVQPLRSFFKTASDEETLGAYMWAQAVSASLHPFVGLAEVTLRNAIHEALSQQCSRGSSKSYAWYDKANANAIPLQGKSLERVEEQLCQGNPPIRKAVQPTPDDVVSNLTFGFWPNIMEGLSQRYAPRTFTDVFPNHPNSKPAHWSYYPNKSPVVIRLKRLQDVRNKICHFEPIWKLHWLNVTGTNWSHSVQGLRTLHTELLELLTWCSADAAAAYKASFAWNWFNRLCTTGAVRAFLADHSSAGILAPNPLPADVVPTAVGSGA